MAQRFALAFFAFVSMVMLTTLTLALLMAPARPAPAAERPGCERNLATAVITMQEAKARVKRLASTRNTQSCALTRQYFLEVVKARAVTALCKNGPERERELGRLDADVEQINDAIASTCG